ncbi:NfeD family protein [Luteimonas aquatica]|uniref:NfeD family protein n=1 Tax=Luteimonas aquatica TaxID=450364 RepID=UPI001F5A2D5A|nr:NfeD family protein [Luteimonas aquatica]
MPWIVYAWAGLALLLIAAETFAPGAFLLWLGFAAGVMFLVTLLFPGMPLLGQAVLFAALSFFFVAVCRRWFRGGGRASDQPALNRRAAALIGRVVPLERAIEQGRGRVQIADAYWDVAGADLPGGAMVRIVAVDGMTLVVEPA